MRALFIFGAVLLGVAFFWSPQQASAKEGWCGGTDTKKCCNDQGNKGNCSCACVPGNCYCGPRDITSGSSSSSGMSLPLVVVEIKNGKVISRRNTKVKVVAPATKTLRIR